MDKMQKKVAQKSNVGVLEAELTPDQPKHVQKGRLTVHDVRAIARLVATRKLTETEACLMLNIDRKRWYNWKSRNRSSEKYGEILAKFKADYVSGLLDNIEDVSKGIGVKQRDWRAAAWIAERIDPRFSAQQQSVNQPQTIQVQVISEAVRRAYSDVIDVQEVKQLTNQKIPARRMTSDNQMNDNQTE